MDQRDDCTNINMRCSNSNCCLGKPGVILPSQPGSKCPVCKAELLPAGESDWLKELADDPGKWIAAGSEEYPSVIAFEYDRLRSVCRDSNAFGALLCLKDNFEALLKFEILIAFAWATKNTNQTFEEETIAKITTANPSMGFWLNLAGSMIKNLKGIAELPDSIPLKVIRDFYEKHKIVNWRNEKIGHGVMGFENGSRFASCSFLGEFCFARHYDKLVV